MAEDALLKLDGDWLEGRLDKKVEREVCDQKVQKFSEGVSEAKEIALAANRKANNHEAVVGQMASWLKYFRAGLAGIVVVICAAVGSWYTMYHGLNEDVSQTQKSITEISSKIESQGQSIIEIKESLRDRKATVDSNHEKQIQAIQDAVEKSLEAMESSKRRRR